MFDNFVYLLDYSESWNDNYIDILESLNKEYEDIRNEEE